MQFMPKPSALTYRIEKFGDTSRIVWTGQSDLSAADVMKSDHRRGGGAKVDLAKAIILKILADGSARRK